MKRFPWAAMLAAMSLSTLPASASTSPARDRVGPSAEPTALLEPAAPESAKAPSSLPPCALCGPSSRPGKALDIQGSTTLRPIVDRASQTASVLHKIRTSGRNLGSTTGIRALIEGECDRRGIWSAGGSCDLGADGVIGTGDGWADIGVSSRPIRATEIGPAEANGICVVEHPVAIDGLGIIVNNDPACSGQFPALGGAGLADYLVANLPGPPTGGLSETQIKEILFGTDPNSTAGGSAIFNEWCDLVGCASGALPNITIVSRQEEGGTYGAFLDLYVCNTGDSTPAPVACSTPPLFPLNTGSNVDPFEWIRPPSSCTPTGCGPNDPPVVNPASGSSPTQFVGSNDEVVSFVSGTCGAVGYAGISFIETAQQAGAPIQSFPVTQRLADPPIAASFATTLDATFDFTRKLFAYTVGTPYGDDPRALYLELLYGRTGQANVLESGFVPMNGVLPRNPGKSLADHAQILLEPIGKELIETSEERIALKLALIARAQETIDQNLDPVEVRNAITDLIESEFSIRETVDADNLLVTRLMDRVSGCLAGGSCADASRASRELARAASRYASAQGWIVADDGNTPEDEYFTQSDFGSYVEQLKAAFEAAQKASAACNP